jgi:hypothetical protein
MKFYSIKEGKFQMDIDSLSKFLAKKGFYSFMPSEGQYWVVRVENKIVTKIDREDLYNFLLDTANKEKYSLSQYRTIAIDRLTKLRGRIVTSIPILLPKLEGEFYTDTKSMGIMVFENVIMLVTAERIEQISIVNGDKFIWGNTIIKRPFSASIPELIYELEGDFPKFMNYISSYIGEDGLESLYSIYGFLLHSYKDRTFAKAVIFYDMNINDADPNGRTGKSLLTSSLQYFRSTVIEDGKNLNPKNQFSFSRVKILPSIFIIDDIKKKFPFDILFTLVSGDFAFERKTMDREVIPFEKSPKIVITSNFDVPGTNQSHKDRRIEYVISDFFNAEHKPIKEFEREFFNGWDDTEWGRFDAMGIKALQYYLQNGIINQDPGKQFYVLAKSTSEAFMSFADTLKTGTRYNIDEQHNLFLQQNIKHPNIGQNTFSRWLKMYAEYKNWCVNHSHSNNIKYMEFTEKPQRRDRHSTIQTHSEPTLSQETSTPETTT